MRRFLSLMTSMLALAMGPAHAADPAPGNERLLVGRTNIFCVMAPCPWRGIARAGAASVGPAGLLWSDAALPRLDASADDARRIMAAWAGSECVVIDGRLSGSVLHVAQVVGECR